MTIDARSGGFTLLELLVVMVIIALLMALVPPLFSGAVPGARLKGAARDLAVELRYARSHAITRNQDMEVRLDLEPPAYAVAGRPPRPLPEGVKMQVVSARRERGLQPASHRVQFYPDGSSSGTRITLSGGNRSYRISVDWLTGRIDIAESSGDAG
jgi:general secretion pathway protein H